MFIVYRFFQFAKSFDKLHFAPCVGGIAPRAVQVSFRSVMSGEQYEDYKFTYDTIRQDPVSTRVCA